MNAAASRAVDKVAAGRGVACKAASKPSSRPAVVKRKPAGRHNARARGSKGEAAASTAANPGTAAAAGAGAAAAAAPQLESMADVLRRHMLPPEVTHGVLAAVAQGRIAKYITPGTLDKLLHRCASCACACMCVFV